MAPDFEDYANTNVAAAVAVTAAVVSNRGRRILRRGAVYGTAGVLMARDVVAAFGRGITQGFRSDETEHEETAADHEGGEPRPATSEPSADQGEEGRE